MQPRDGIVLDLKAAARPTTEVPIPITNPKHVKLYRRFQGRVGTGYMGIISGDYGIIISFVKIRTVDPTFRL